MIASHREAAADENMAAKQSPILIQWLDTSRTYSNLRISMTNGFDGNQLFAITKAIIELNYMSGGSDLHLNKRPLHKRTRYKDDALVFYKEDKQIQSGYHNTPQYFTVFIYDAKLRRGF